MEVDGAWLLRWRSLGVAYLPSNKRRQLLLYLCRVVLSLLRRRLRTAFKLMGAIMAMLAIEPLPDA